MSTIERMVVVVILIISAVIVELALDKVSDTSWPKVFLKITLAFVIISAIGLSLKWMIDMFF